MVVVLLPYNNATTEHLISVSGMSALATHYLNVETFFNKYKEVCAAKITEAKKSFEGKGDKASSDRLGVVLEQISNKSFMLDTVGADICSFIELSNIFE